MFQLLEPLSKSKQKELELLREKLKSFKTVCVAYSGGVDSSLVAAIAQEQLGKKAFAITGVSPSLATHLRNEAKNQANWLGILHQECFTNELKDPNYSKNPKDRCFSCKRELHQHLSEIALKSGGAQVVDGVNHDDLSEYRPGIEAARQAGVRSPLAELGINKTTVRQISRALGLPWWNKPAQPCLASRLPYGEAVNSQRLQQIEKAENWLRNHGFEEVRVRSQNGTAKIELPANQIEQLIINFKKENIVKYFIALGFTSVSVDLEGLISGKLNRGSTQL